MSAAPTAAVLNQPALELMCRTARKNIADEMAASVFRGDERKRTHQTIKDLDDPQKLHGYLKAVRAERKAREDKLHAACEDGSFTTGLSLD